MRERLNRAVSKTVEPLRVPWVRIPPSPPEFISFFLQLLANKNTYRNSFCWPPARTAITASLEFIRLHSGSPAFSDKLVTVRPVRSKKRSDCLYDRP